MPVEMLPGGHGYWTVALLVVHGLADVAVSSAMPPADRDKPASLLLLLLLLGRVTLMLDAAG